MSKTGAGKKYFLHHVPVKSNGSAIWYYVFLESPAGELRNLEEKKQLRAKKVAAFKETAEYRILGESMDADSWLRKNNDDEKKAVVKSYDKKVCIELGLTGVE